jgi:hypothetical protein
MLDRLGDISLFGLAHQNVAFDILDQFHGHQIGGAFRVGRRPQGKHDLMAGLEVTRLEDLAHFRNGGMGVPAGGARVGQHRHQGVAIAHGELALICHRQLRRLGLAVLRVIGKLYRRRLAGLGIFGQQGRLDGGMR